MSQQEDDKLDKILKEIEKIKASVFRLGRRGYDATYIVGKSVRIVLFNVALADIGDKEDVLKSEYTI